MGRTNQALNRRESPASDLGVETLDPAGSPWTFDADAARRVASMGGDAVGRRSATTVPDFGRHAGSAEILPNAADRLVVTKSVSPALVEQFRNLAATLQQAKQDRQFKSLMVTSAVPGDGKSLVSANLALTLSESFHQPVLLVDADLRRPSLQTVFRLPDTGGLSAALRKRGQQRLDVVPFSETLSLLPAGPSQANPLGGLASDRMKQILNRATELFDWVIVDTPPAGMLADGVVLSGMVDAVVLVVRSGVTQYEQADATLTTLGKDRVLGVILNGADPEEIHARKYYGRYYDNYGD